MKKKRKIFLGVIIAALTISGFVGGTVYYLIFAHQFRITKTGYIYIDRDDTPDSIRHKVEATAKPRYMEGYDLLNKAYDRDIRPGRYAVTRNDNMFRLYKRLVNNHQTPVNLTIRSERTLERLARSLGNQLMIDSVEIIEKLNNTNFIDSIGYTKETILCLFVPNTYEVYWTTSANELLNRIRKEHDAFWNAERLDKATAIGLTSEEVCTLASIVDEETNANAEKPTVAGLYMNRLHKGIPLQADPTVKFALKEFGLKRILNKDLDVDSPYNTYKVKGLPPGPIRIASIQGIESVLNYERHHYLFMVAKEDFSGTHNFAATLNEHNANAGKYREALNARKIYR